MSAAFLTALADDFEAHGKATVEKVREQDPSTYLRIFATLAPKELEVTRPLEGVSDEELAAFIEHLRQQVPANDQPSSEGLPVH